MNWYTALSCAIIGWALSKAGIGLGNPTWWVIVLAHILLRRDILNPSQED